MTVYRILASRTELYLIEAHVRAATVEEAESKFYGALEYQEDAVSWIQDLDSSDTDIHSIERVPVDHDAVPSSGNPSVCLYCGRPVRWTGTPADESSTGQTVAGPWIHIRRPMAGEGLGL